MPSAFSALTPVQDAPAALRVDAHGRLVHVDDLGLVQQRHADVQSPLHAAGERFDLALLPLREAGQLQHLGDPLLKRIAAQIVHLAPEHQVAPGREILVERDLLRHHTQRLLDAHRRLSDGMPHHPRIARRRLQQAREHGNHRRLARAVGAQQAENLPALYGKVNAFHGMNVAVVFV